MLNSLIQLLNLRRDETRRFAVFSVMMFFFIVGYVWANITIVSQFVSTLGAGGVPLLLVADALIIIITFAVYSGVADRFSNARIMADLNSVGIVGIIIGVLLIQFEPQIFGSVKWAYLFLYMVFRSVGEAISTHWGPYVNDYFDTRAAKRIFTLLGAVVRFSYVIGALSLNIFNSTGTGGLIYVGLGVWMVTLIAMLVMSTMNTSLMGLRPIQSPSSSDDRDKKSYWQNLREGYHFAFTSHYLRAFVVTSLVMMLMLALMQYQILAILDTAYKDLPNSDTAISDFLAQITFWGSILLLPFQLFVFNRLVAWAGVEKVNLVFPMTSLMTAVGLAFVPMLANETVSFVLPIIGITVLIAIAAIAEFNRTILNIGIRAINDEFLYNAVPVRVKGRTRGFISGIVEPLGTLLAGLLVALPIISISWFIPSLLVTLGIAYVLASLWVSRQYGKALVNMIQDENYSFLLHGSNQIVIDGDTIQSLEKRLQSADNDDTRLLLVRLLVEARGEQYIPMLTKLAENGSSYLRAGIVDAFVSADLRSEQVLDLCSAYVADPHPAVRKSAITGLKQLSGAESDRYLLAALQVLNDADTTLIAEVLPDLINSHDYFFLQQSTRTLNTLLDSENAQERALGAQILGHTSSRRVILLLMRYLIDRSQVVRLQAIIAIENILEHVAPNDEIVRALEMTISSLLRDPVDRVRLAAVRILEKLLLPDLSDRLMPSLMDNNLEVRDTAVEMLIKHPASSLKTFEPLLKSGHPLVGRMATVVMVRIKPGYEPHIYEHVDGLLRQMYINIDRIAGLETIKRFSTVTILQDFLLENNEQLLNEIFYLLGNVHGKESVEVIALALQSTASRTRANAIEALDIMLSQTLLTSIEHLTDPDMSLKALNAYGQRIYQLKSLSAKEVLQELLHLRKEEWMQYIAVEAMGELGQKLFEAQNSQKPANPLDMLAGLGGQSTASKHDDIPFTRDEIEQLLNEIDTNQNLDLRTALRKARNALNGVTFELADQAGTLVISEVERVIFLKRVAFFRDVTINQLRRVADVCQEVWFNADTSIFNIGEEGGKLYVIVEGRVGIERLEADGKLARLKTLGYEDSFGEDTLADKSKNTTSAQALSRTLVLSLDHASFLGLMQAYPDMSLKVIRALSQQIREINVRITNMNRQESMSDNLLNKL